MVCRLCGWDADSYHKAIKQEGDKVKQDILAKLSEREKELEKDKEENRRQQRKCSACAKGNVCASHFMRYCELEGALAEVRKLKEMMK